MANLEDVYIRIHLDSTNVAPEYKKISDAMDAYQEKLQKLIELAEKEGREPKSDPAVQEVTRKLKTIESIYKQNRQFFMDIEELMNNLAKATTKELLAGAKQVEKEVRDLTRMGKDIERLEEKREQYNKLMAEIEQRNIKTRAFSSAWLNAQKESMDQINKLVKQTAQAVLSSDFGSKAQQQAFAYYRKFREYQEKLNGEMSLGQATRLARGTKVGDVNLLKEAVKYLQDYRAEWDKFNTKDQSSKLAENINKANARLLEMSRNIANGTIKASFADMQTALAVIKQRWETLDPSVKKNATLIAELGKEYNRLKTEIDQWGKATMSKADAANVLAGSLRLIKQGADADATAMRYYMEQLKLAQNAEGISVRNAQALYSAEKQINEILHTVNPTPMRGLVDILNDISSAKTLAQMEALRSELQTVFKTISDPIQAQKARTALDGLNESIKNFGVTPPAPLRSVGEILNDISSAKTLAQMEALRAELQTVFKTVSDPMQAQQARTALDGLNESIKNFGNVNIMQKMKVSSPADAITQAKYSLSVAKANPNTISASYMRDNQELMSYIKTLDVSVNVLREASFLEKEISGILSGKNAIMVESADIVRQNAVASRLLSEGERANSGEVTRTIEAYRQMMQAENITVREKKELGTTMRQLEQMLKVNQQATMTYSDAVDVLNQGQKASVGEIKRAIESLSILASKESTTAEEAKKYNDTIAQLQKLTRQTAKTTRDLAYDEKFVIDTLRSMNTQPIENLERAALMLKRRMTDAQTSLKDYVTASKNLREVRAKIDAINGSVKSNETFFSKAITKLTSYIGIFGGFYFVTQKVREAFEMNIKYDDSLSNIRKTTGLTSEAVAMLADNIKRIDTRTTLADMNELAYSAGRLGVKGVGNVMGFVRAADKIKIALGEQLGDSSEAIEQLMKITSIMGVQEQYGLEESIIRVGSSMNHLTMNSQATAQPIVDFMKRVAGVSAQAGIASSELVGLAGAVNALGQPVEMTATSFSKMLVQISGHSDKIMKALKMNAQESRDFMYNIASGQMMDAFLMVLQKTNEAGGLSHLSTIAKDLGSEGQRVIQTIATLSKNYEFVSSMVRMSNDAFDEGTSVINEYNLKQSNTAALLEKIKNKFDKNMVSTEVVDYIREILIELQHLPDAARDFALSFRPVIDTLKTLVLAIARAPEFISALVQAMLINSVVQRFRAGIDVAFTSIIRFTTGIKGAFTSMKAFIAFTKTAAFGNVFTAALTIVLTIFNKLRTGAEETKRMMEENIGALERTKNQMTETSSAIETLIAKIKSSTEGTKERKDLIDEINKTYGDYLSYQLQDAAGNEAIAESLRQVNKELELKALLEGRAEKNKQIDQNYSTSVGQAENTLTNTVASLLEGGSPNARNAVAADIVRYLTSVNPENGKTYGSQFLAVEERDEAGNIISYASPFNRKEENSAEAIKSIREILYPMMDQIIAKWNVNPRNEFDQITGRKSMEGGIFGAGSSLAITRDLARLSNELAKRDNEKRITDMYWNRESRAIIDGVEQKLTKDIEDLWGKISEYVTQNGALADRKVSSDTAKKEKDPWIAIKNSLDTKGRVALETDLKAYLNRIDDYMVMLDAGGNRYQQGMEQIPANYTDIYRQAEINRYNAQSMLDVVRIGKIITPVSEDSLKKTNDKVDNIIEKIKTFYEIQEEYMREQLNRQLVTETQNERNLMQNQVNMYSMLSAARKAIVGDIDASAYNSMVATMKSQNIAGAIGQEQYERVAKMSYRDIRNIGLKSKDNADNDSSFINGMRRKAWSDENSALNIQNKLVNQVAREWMEQNPMGKLTEQYQKEFETLGLMLHELKATETQTLSEITESIMSEYLQVGRETYKYSVLTDEGIQKFREYLKGFAMIKDGAEKASDAVLAKLYYKAFEYAEQYDQAIARLTERTINNWNRMYKSDESHNSLLNQINAMEHLIKLYSQMEKYGFSGFVTQDSKIESMMLKYQDASNSYENKLQNAKAHRQAAEALVVGAKDKDGNLIDAKYKQNEIESADSEIQRLQPEAESLNQMMNEIIDAELTLRENTNAWIEDMEVAFTKFMDAFVPFRSWYEQNGSLASNVFGTKEQRQEAFGAFMDDLKKTTREAIAQQVRLRVSKKVQDKMETAQEKLELKIRKRYFNQTETEKTLIKELQDKIQMKSDTTKTAVEGANSDIGTTKTLTNKTRETTGSVLGNMAQAVSKAFADLGPIAGAVAAGVVTAAITAVLTMAMNALGGAKKSKSETPTKTKLVSGMLTYDRGNVQYYGGYSKARMYDRGYTEDFVPVMGDDGEVYWASPDSGKSSTGLITKPTLMNIGGVPSLVAEKGPEMVIGRETTAAMQMYNPELLRQIVLFDRNHSNGYAKTYDRGNVQDIGGYSDRDNSQLMEMLTGMSLVIAQSNEVNARLAAELQRGIRASVSKRELVTSTAEGFVEARNMGNDNNIRRLFG